MSVRGDILLFKLLSHYELVVEHGQLKSAAEELGLKQSNLSKEMKQIPVKNDTAVLKISAKELEYHFEVETEGETILMGTGETRYLSSEVAGGFTGVVYGLYAVDKNGRGAEFTRLSILHEE